ncbi:hypothetical protein V6N13_053674 [Hibiscus sabdariffa]
MTSMANVCRNNMTTPALNFKAEDGGSSSSISSNITPMQLEVAFEQPPPLPVNENLNYDNYGWPNSTMMFNDDDHLDLFANQLDDTVSEEPFSELWSWDNWPLSCTCNKHRCWGFLLANLISDNLSCTFCDVVVISYFSCNILPK